MCARLPSRIIEFLPANLLNLLFSINLVRCRFNRYFSIILLPTINRSFYKADILLKSVQFRFQFNLFVCTFSVVPFQFVLFEVLSFWVTSRWFCCIVWALLNMLKCGICYGFNCKSSQFNRCFECLFSFIICQCQRDFWNQEINGCLLIRIFFSGIAVQTSATDSPGSPTIRKNIQSAMVFISFQ